ARDRKGLRSMRLVARGRMKPTSFWRAMAGAGGQLREQGPCRNSDRPRRQQIFQMLAPAGGHPRNFNPRPSSRVFPELPAHRSTGRVLTASAIHSIADGGRDAPAGLHRTNGTAVNKTGYNESAVIRRVKVELDALDRQLERPAHSEVKMFDLSSRIL